MGMKACIDYSAILFHPNLGIPSLAQENVDSYESYAWVILALFKKRYPKKIPQKPEELFGLNANIEEALETVRKDLWIYTLEKNTVVPTKDCLELRAKNLSFQLRIWMQATNPYISVPNPLLFGREEIDGGLRLTPE